MAGINYLFCADVRLSEMLLVVNISQNVLMNSKQASDKRAIRKTSKQICIGYSHQPSFVNPVFQHTQYLSCSPALEPVRKSAKNRGVSHQRKYREFRGS